MRASDITMTQSDDTTTLDFSAFSSMQENDYFEVHINNIVIKLNVNSNMTVDSFAQWLSNNLNNNYDFYNIATAVNNNNSLDIKNKTTDSITVSYDFNR